MKIRKSFKKHDHLGNPVASETVQGARHGMVTLSGIRPDTYVAEVLAKGYAKNYSEPFTLHKDQASPPTVIVRLHQGGQIHGYVRDQAGRGLRESR